MKKMVSALAGLVLLAGCADPAMQENQRVLAESRVSVLSTLGSDVDAQASTLAATCIATLDGRAPDDARLTRPPFSKTSEGGKVVYRGQWQGQGGFKAGGTLLEASAAECSFPSVGNIGMARQNAGAVSPRPELVMELQKAGYSVSAFSPVTLGGVFLRGALGGLTPGGTSRSLEGTMTAAKGGQTLQVRVFAFKMKSDLALVGTLVTIGRE